MQKLLAILLSLLLYATQVAGTCLPADMVEKLADSDKSKEGQPEKKDTKEFLATAANNIFAIKPAVDFPTGITCYGLPNVTFQILKPPPNIIC